ncbi:MAG: NlpC/P60 family protein [Candidatus Limivivens sp.]|nr:NlpC/P60 family protein [Candidatus Limivivens sp.]
MKKNFLVVLSLAGVICLTAPAMKTDAAWKITASGRQYTIDAKPGYAIGLKKIGNYWYYFDKNGYAQTGWQIIEKKQYYFDARGRMVTNRWVDGRYLSADGSVSKNASAAAASESLSNSSSTVYAKVKNGWVKKSGKYYYYENGQMVTGWITVKGKTYYLSVKDGSRKTGIAKINGSYYYFDTKTGAQKTGWITYKNYKYFFSRKSKGGHVGAALTGGWHSINNRWYYFNGVGKLYRNRWVSKKYYVNSKGQRVTGWLTLGSDHYYLDPKTGLKTTGWKTIDGKRYFFNSNGTLKQLSGVVTITKKKYFFDPSTGQQQTGWVTFQDATYYFDPETGEAYKGWKKIDGYYYYFNKSYQVSKGPKWINDYLINEQGQRQYGWADYNGKHYYLDLKTGKKLTGSHTIDGVAYLFDSTGALDTMVGLQYIDGKYYYYDPTTGEQQTGWVTDNGRTYYFDETTRTAVKGWKLIDGNYYYFSSKYTLSTGPKWINSYYINEAGQRQYGWLELNGQKYYLHSVTGKRITGWKTIKGITYHFSGSGVMTVSAWVDDRYLGSDGILVTNQWVDEFYVGADGKKTGETRQKGLFTGDDGYTYYLGDDYRKVTGWVTIDGQNYFFNSKGQMVKGRWFNGKYFDEDGIQLFSQFITVDNTTYYVKENGQMAVGLLSVEGKTYYFDEYGELITGFYNVQNSARYFDPEQNGAMVVSTEKEINGVTYKFNEHGIFTLADNSNASRGQEIANYALKFLTQKYVYGGSWDGEEPYTPTDCSGFVMGVFAHFGIRIPRVAADQAVGYEAWNKNYAKAIVVSIAELMPGDLVFYYNPIGHVGMYIGNGKIVHASNSQDYPAGGIKISEYDYSTPVVCVRYWANQEANQE